jgi:hypothetical protein
VIRGNGVLVGWERRDGRAALFNGRELGESAPVLGLSLVGRFVTNRAFVVVEKCFAPTDTQLGLSMDSGLATTTRRIGIGKRTANAGKSHRKTAGLTPLYFKNTGHIGIKFDAERIVHRV